MTVEQRHFPPPGTAAAGPKATPPFAALKAFEAFGRCGGVRRAASALNLDHAVVSRHLRALEAWTGARLIDRTPGAQGLTEDGRKYFQRLTGAIAEIADATSEIMRRDSERRLVVWGVPGFTTEWLSKRIWSFHRAHPELDIELHPTDVSPDFLRYEADVDIRYAPISDEPAPRGVRRVEIARPPTLPVASPELLAALSPIRSAADLLNAPLLHEENTDQWARWFEHNKVEAPEHLLGPRMWHAHLTLDAARRGHGVALANAFLLGEDLDSGRLIDLTRLGGRPVVLGAYSFATRADRWQAPPIVRLRRWLEQEAKALLQQRSSRAALSPKVNDLLAG